MATETPIVAMLAEVVANEDDPAWQAWTRDRMRLQGQLHELRAVRDRLTAKIASPTAAAEPAQTGGRQATRRELRGRMGRGGLLPLAQAVEMLPTSDAEAREWLRLHGLVGDLAGREVVDWGRVLEVPFTPTPPGDSSTRPRARNGRTTPLPRVPLGAPSGRR